MARGSTRLSVTFLEGRTTPAAVTAYAVGVDVGETGDAVLYSDDGTEQVRVAPFGSDFTGGARVAVADVTGDGEPDLIAAVAKDGVPTVKVFDGATDQLVASFPAYEESFTGGVNVAAADLNGDGKAEIVTGADDGGGPRVRVFDGATVAAGDGPTVIADFLAIDDDNFRGGVRIALGDLSGDGTADLLVAAGYGGGPRVTAFDGAALGTGDVAKIVDDFFAFEESLRNGSSPAVTDVNGDGCGDMVLGAGEGGAPRVRVFDGKPGAGHGELSSFFAGDTAGRDGVTVGTVTLDDGTTAIVGTESGDATAGVFTADGKMFDFLTTPGGKGPPIAGLPFARRGGVPNRGGSGTGSDSGGDTGTGTTDGTAARPTLDSATLEGTYTGTATGQLITFPVADEAEEETDVVSLWRPAPPRPVVTDTAATLSITLTAAATTDDADPAATDATTGTTGAGSAFVKLTGTVTVTLDGADPVTVEVEGFARAVGRGTDTATRAKVFLRAVRPTETDGDTATAPMLTLTGDIEGEVLTVRTLGLAEHSDADPAEDYAFHIGGPDGASVQLTRG